MNPKDGTNDYDVAPEDAVSIRKARRLRDQAYAMILAADRLESLPTEPGRDGVALVYFSKSFGRPEGPVYEYAALRLAEQDRWVTTSTQASRHDFKSWDALLDFIISGEDPFAVPEIYLATALEAM